MNVELIFDPVFRTPFAVGLLMSVLLPLLGNLLRLRDEWLAALGLGGLALRLRARAATHKEAA